MDSIADLLDTAERAGGHRPFLTFVDLDSGERTELSFVVAANWARKIANFAQTESEAEPGVVLDWPPLPHWTTPLVALGMWAAGAGVRAGERDPRWPEPATADFDTVLAEPDQLDAPAPDPHAPALVADGETLDHAWLLARAGEPPGRRVWLRHPALSPSWCAAVTGALGGRAHLVLVHGGDDAGRRRAAEREGAADAVPPPA